MKGMHGVRLRPDRAAVEVVVRLHNRTSQTQTFLWWANAAARANDDYQAFFPTDVSYVADHARRALTAFPSADRSYYGVDYPNRADGGDRIDWYRNVTVPTSYMVTDTADDFFGGYDHGKRAGFVHVADRHIAPGKKMWTWGNAPFGYAWDRLLTDGDGPYVELMAGVYTDNQPDFAWLEPGETKTFTQLWYPIQEMGPAHQANAEAALRLDVEDDEIRLGLCVPAVHAAARVSIEAVGERVWADVVDLTPDMPLIVTVPAHGVGPEDVEVSVHVQDGAELIRWRPRPVSTGREPWTASAPMRAEEIATVDELYLTGIHLTQYRHPSRSPEPYFAEALRRDPGHAATHIALAADDYRRARYDAALEHAAAAVRRLTVRNGNPRDGEAHYLLGLAGARRGESAAARDALAKAAWDVRWAGPAHVELARLAAREGRAMEALHHAETALRAVPEDSRAEAVRVVALRSLGRDDDAVSILERWRDRDPLDQTARALSDQPLTADGRTLLDVARDLDSSGDADRALVVLDQAVAAPITAAGNVGPVALYQRAMWLERSGDHAGAAPTRQRARTADASWCFPLGLDDHDVLRAALAADPEDGRAAALLGMLLFDAGREEEALQLWAMAIEGGLQDAVTYRNAAIATVNLRDDFAGARWFYDCAIALDLSARLLYERDQLLARYGGSASERLALLEPHLALVLGRDDLTVCYCGLLTAEGRSREALDMLRSRPFAPWEGGEGRAISAWEAAAGALSREAESRGDIAEAIEYAELAIDHPETLGEVRHPLTDTSELHERLASLWERLGRPNEAQRTRAAAVASDTAPVAASVDDDEVDYFATSLPDLLLFDRRRTR
jgi:tetratricopeptide (TPR) repeat protein